MVSEKTLTRMKDESIFPTDEVSALVYKMLLQHCVEMDHLDEFEKRQENGEEMDYETELSTVMEGQRQVHLEFAKRFPGFKYANELSYAYNPVDGQPYLISVNETGKVVPFKVKHDFIRDDIINKSIETIFKNHTRVFEDGSYEFCWEVTGLNHEFSFMQHPQNHTLH
jgi:hypothetical protein